MSAMQHREPNEAPSEPDTAVWNFPNGWRGELTARIRLPAGSQGAIFSLNDRFFDPSNTLGEDAAVFQARVTAENTQPDTWHTLSLRWDLGAASASIVSTTNSSPPSRCTRARSMASVMSAFVPLRTRLIRTASSFAM
jgi:hypothetical protein